MSHVSAADSESFVSSPADSVLDLRSLDEGIAILTRFEEVLSELEDALDSMTLQGR